MTVDNNPTQSSSIKLILASQSVPRKQLLEQLKLKFDVIPANIDEIAMPDEPPIELVKRLSIAKSHAVYNKLSNNLNKSSINLEKLNSPNNNILEITHNVSDLSSQTSAKCLEPESISKDPSSTAEVTGILDKPCVYIIISSDQVAVHNNTIYGKPITSARAVEQLTLFNNSTIEFITGLSILVFDNTSEQKIIQNYYDYEISKIKLKNLSEQQIIDYINIEKPFKAAASFKIECLGVSLVEKIDTDDYNAIIGLPIIKLVKILDKVLNDYDTDLLNLIKK